MPRAKTKVVATIGPSTWDDDVILGLVNSGLQVARINASFADDAEIERVTKQFRRLAPEVTILLDTMGHKIRVSGFEEEIAMVTGEKATIVSKNIDPAEGEIQITYPNLHDEITRGARILLDDGNIILAVSDIKDSKIICDIKQGGMLKPKKTVNLPDVHLNFPSLTEKDRSDIASGKRMKVDMIAASFVRDLKDVEIFKAEVNDPNIKIIAKIEDQEGVDNFDEILANVDGIMVARGDLGVELRPEEVPPYQKIFINKCQEAAKPVIVATQMLESMRENLRATRAEINDVANAVFDGVDAVMLSAETSTGKHPIEAVQTMQSVALQMEDMTDLLIRYGRTEATKETDAICRSLANLCYELDLKAVIVLSKTGQSVRSLSRHRIDTVSYTHLTLPTIA